MHLVEDFRKSSVVCGTGRDIVVCFGLNTCRKVIVNALDLIAQLVSFSLCVPPATDHRKSRNYLQFYKKETWSSKTSLKCTLNKTWCVYFSELSLENCPLNYCSENEL